MLLRRTAAFAILLAISFALEALEAGAAKVDITPPIGTPLNGYFDRLGRGATGVHDPVWVRCLYLNDGSAPVFLLNADLCIINRELRARVLELAPKDVPPQNIILTATHTHSAQGGMNKSLLARSIAGRFVPEVLEATAGRFVEAMTAAYEGRRRATLGYGTTTQHGMSENRRVPGGPLDPQVGVIRVDDSDGRPIAIVANFAAHPTTVGGGDMFSISADYPGVYYTELERLAGGACVAMFLNGAEGNQRPANPENKDGWSRTESIGRMLAAKVMEAAASLTCREATVRVGHSSPTLPPTLASSLMPSSTTLVTLEINDLLLTFFPGEPCVEIGLEMRRIALERGYAAQFTVGLANDHLLYFVPRELYPSLYYESAMNMYGPFIDSWFYREFGALMTRGTQPDLKTDTSTAEVRPIEGAVAVALSGTAREIGYARGAAFREAVTQAFEDAIVSPCSDGRLTPESGLWSWAPPFINRAPLALPQLGIGVRPLLAGLPADVMEELDGMALGAGLAFDAVWLTQCAPLIHAQTDKDAVYRSPFCTMFAVTGDKAGPDDILVGRNLDWEKDEAPVVMEIGLAGALRYLQIGFSWNAGVYSGMNEAGLVVCVERDEKLGAPSLDGPPVEFVLREALQRDRSVSEVLARVEAAPHLRGYHVLIADARGENARVVDLGAARTTRLPVGGVLLGTDPAFAGDPETAVRYTRAKNLLNAERILDSAEMESVLRDAEAGRTGRQCILNPHTRHSVVFEPRARRLHVAFPGGDGKLGTSSSFVLRPNSP